MFHLIYLIIPLNSSMNLFNLHFSERNIDINQENLFAYNIYRAIFFIQNESYDQLLEKYYSKKNISEYVKCTSYLLRDIYAKFYNINDYENLVRYLLTPLDDFINRDYKKIEQLTKIKKSSFEDLNDKYLHFQSIISYFIEFIIMCKILDKTNLHNFNSICSRNHNGMYYRYTYNSIESFLIKDFSDVHKSYNIDKIEKLDIFIKRLDKTCNTFLLNFDITDYFFNNFLKEMEMYIAHYNKFMKSLVQQGTIYENYNSVLTEKIIEINEKAGKYFVEQVLNKLSTKNEYYIIKENMNKKYEFAKKMFNYFFPYNQIVNELLAISIKNYIHYACKAMSEKCFNRELCSAKKTELLINKIYIYKIEC